MNLSELISRLQELEKRHGPNKDVALVIKVPRPGGGLLPPKYIIAEEVISLGTSGRPELKDKVVIYGTKD